MENLEALKEWSMPLMQLETPPLRLLSIGAFGGILLKLASQGARSLNGGGELEIGSPRPTDPSCRGSVSGESDLQISTCSWFDSNLLCPSIATARLIPDNYKELLGARKMPTFLDLT